MNTHINIAAIIHIVLGALGLLAGVAVVAIIGLGGGLAALAALAEGTAGDVIGVGMGTFVVGALAASAALLALPGLLAGVGLLNRKPWAPMVALIVSCFHLLNFPFGTMLSVYTGWALLSEEGQRAYRLGESDRRRLR